MSALVERITRDGGATRQQLRSEKAKVRPKAGRPRHFVFAWRAPQRTFDVKLRFKKAEVERAEVIAALESLLSELRTAQMG